MVRILETLPGDLATVSTRGLRRVVLRPSGEVMGELLTAREAESLARLVRAEWTCGDNRVCVERYKSERVKPFKAKRPAVPFRSAT